MESLDQLKQKKEAFYKTCRNLIILNHNSYSLKIKIQDETPDHDTNKVIPGKLSRNCLRQEKNLVENMRDTIYNMHAKRQKLFRS